MDNTLLALIFGVNAIGIASVIGLFCPPGSATRKLGGTVFFLWLLAFAAFCAFGFAASFEPPVDQPRPWRIGCPIAGFLALGGSAMAGRRAFKKA